MSPPTLAVIRGAGWVDAAGPGSPTGPGPFRPGVEPLPRIRWQQVSDAPNPRFGRLDAFSRTGLLAVATALKDAGLAKTGGAKRPVGIIASTDLGCLGTDLDYYDTVLPQNGALASPNRFVYTLPNCFLGEAAIVFGFTGPGFVVNPGPDDPLAALAMALDWLSAGACPTMLAGFCDAPPPELATAGVPAGAGFVVLERPPAQSSIDPPRGSGTFPEAGRAFCEGIPAPDTPLVTRCGSVQASETQDSAGERNLIAAGCPQGVPQEGAHHDCCPLEERARSRPTPSGASPFDATALRCHGGTWLLGETPVASWHDLFTVLSTRPFPSGDAP